MGLVDLFLPSVASSSGMCTTMCSVYAWHAVGQDCMWQHSTCPLQVCPCWELVCTCWHPGQHLIKAPHSRLWRGMYNVQSYIVLHSMKRAPFRVNFFHKLTNSESYGLVVECGLAGRTQPLVALQGCASENHKCCEAPPTPHMRHWCIYNVDTGIRVVGSGRVERVF